MLDRAYRDSPFQAFTKAVPTAAAEPLTDDHALVLGNGFTVRAPSTNTASVYLVPKAGVVGDAEELLPGARAAVSAARPSLFFCISATPGQVLKVYGS